MTAAGAGPAGLERGEVAFGNSRILYTLTRSTRRRKTVEITLDPVDGVLVAAPAAMAAETIRGLVERRAAWIIRTQAESPPAPPRKEFVSGESLPYLGRLARLTVEPADVRSVDVSFAPWEFQIVAPVRLRGDERRERIRDAFVGWYRQQAASMLRERVDRWSAVGGFAPGPVLVREQRQRWGSCALDGTLRFNWRIVMAEPALIDYVVIHELAHLRERRHTPAFWREVSRLAPDFQFRRNRLREIGASLAF